MLSLSEDCELLPLSEENKICEFDCGNSDLNDFFCNDALNYQNQMLGQTLFFKEINTGNVVCAFTLSNDSIKVSELPGSRRRLVKTNIPHVKSQKSYPATLIGRLGVSLRYKKNGVGKQLMDFIKSMTLTEDSYKCRFLLVDSYNNTEALSYYIKNDFNFVFSTEDQEMEYYKKDNPLNTRFMFYDLKIWKDKM